MGGGRFDYSSVIIRFLFSLFFVLATYNPSGVSYFHWIQSLSDLPLKLLVGLILLGIYAMLAVSTWKLIGGFGVALMVLVCATAGWTLWELGVIDLGSLSAVSTGFLVMLAVIFTAGMSYSGIHTRLTGLLHTQIK